MIGVGSSSLDYQDKCIYSAQVNSLDCMEFSYLSNVLSLRGYQPNRDYMAYPRLVDMTPQIYAMYASTDTQVISTTNFHELNILYVRVVSGAALL